MAAEALTSHENFVAHEISFVQPSQSLACTKFENKLSESGNVNSTDCGAKLIASTHSWMPAESIQLPAMVRDATTVDNESVRSEQSSKPVSVSVSTTTNKIIVPQTGNHLTLPLTPQLAQSKIAWDTRILESERDVRFNANNAVQSGVLTEDIAKQKSSLRLKCGVCGATFSLMVSLENHMNTKHDPKMVVSGYLHCFACNICNASFSTKESLLAHTNRCCKPFCGLDVVFPCLTCDKSFNTIGDFKRHVADQTHELTWFCFSCNKQFQQESVLRIHSCCNFDDGIGHQVREPMFACTICSKIFYESKIFVNHSNCCAFSEYCAQCAKHCQSLRDILEHSKKCGRTTTHSFCTLCNLFTQSASDNSRLEKETIILKRIHCRCCGKCFEEINDDFLDHEANCGVSNRYEQISLSTVVWPLSSKAVWAEQCSSCVVLKITTNNLNKLEKSKQLSKREHCMFCGKCFIEKSTEFIAHEEMCAWIEKCTSLDFSKASITLEHQANKLKSIRQYLQCQFCGKRFNEKFMEFFHHEANCKLLHNRWQRKGTSPQMFPLAQQISEGTNKDVNKSNFSDPTPLTSEPSIQNSYRSDFLPTTTDKLLLHKNNTVCDKTLVETPEWCRKCGHCFSSGHLADHPCKSFRRHMQACYVALERIDINLLGCDSQLNGALPLKCESFRVLPGGGAAPQVDTDILSVIAKKSYAQPYFEHEAMSKEVLISTERPLGFLPFVTDIHDKKSSRTIVGSRIPVGVDTLPQVLTSECALSTEIRHEGLDQALPISPQSHEIKHFVNPRNGVPEIAITRSFKSKTMSLTGSCSLDQFIGDLPKIVATHFCKMCKRPFDSEKLYVWHLRTHDEYRPFPCSYCGCKFKRLSNVLEHVRFYHLKGQVPCYKCGRRFANSYLLRKHSKTHTGHYQFKSRKVDPSRPYFELNRWKKKNKILQRKMVLPDNGKYSCISSDAADADFPSTGAPSSIHAFSSLPSDHKTNIPINPQEDKIPINVEKQTTFSGGKDVYELGPTTAQEMDRLWVQKYVIEAETTSHDNSASPQPILEAENILYSTQSSSHVAVEEKVPVSQNGQMKLMQNEQETFMYSPLDSAVALVLSF